MTNDQAPMTDEAGREPGVSLEPLDSEYRSPSRASRAYTFYDVLDASAKNTHEVAPRAVAASAEAAEVSLEEPCPNCNGKPRDKRAQKPILYKPASVERSVPSDQKRLERPGIRKASDVDPDAATCEPAHV